MFCWFLADIVCSMSLSIRTLKIYVTDLQNGPKNIVKSNVKIKIAFTNFYTGIIILTFLAAGNLVKCRHSRFFPRELTAFMTVVNGSNGVAIIL